MQSVIQIGDRLKIIRSELGLSQQKAADAIGVRREMWAKYESGSEPGAKAIAGMLQAGFDVAFILTGQRSNGMRDDRKGLYSEKELENAVRKMLVDADLIGAISVSDDKTFELLVMMVLLNLTKGSAVPLEEVESAQPSKSA